MNITYLNKNFRFVFTEKETNRRFLIGGGSIPKYFGSNTESVQKSIQKMKTDKLTLKFRKCGKLEIYVK